MLIYIQFCYCTIFPFLGALCNFLLSIPLKTLTSLYVCELYQHCHVKLASKWSPPDHYHKSSQTQLAFFLGLQTKIQPNLFVRFKTKDEDSSSCCFKEQWNNGLSRIACMKCIQLDRPAAILVFSWYHEKVRNSHENVRTYHDFIKNHFKNLVRKWEIMTF